MRRIRLETAALYVTASVFLAFTLFPVYWAINSSLQTSSDLFKVNYIPPQPTLENYWSVFKSQPFGQNILNSLLVASLTVAASLGLAVFASYALGRVRFLGHRLLLYTVLVVTMFPQVSILAGMLELIRTLGLYNNVMGLALSYLLFTLPFTIWILTNFMRNIPAEIEEAALMDGAPPWQVITRILLPIVRPGLVTAGLLAFVAAWNEFLFALTFTLTYEARTVPVAIALLSGANQYELPWGQIMAASVIVTIPVVLIAVAFQRRIIAGLTAGAIKR